MECIYKDNFCRICGCVIKTPSKRYDMRINTHLKNSFCQYFKMRFVGDLWFAPDYSCSTCARTLYGWVKREPWKQFIFKIPMTWREPPLHDAKLCYFCRTHQSGFGSTIRTKIDYKYNTFALPPMKREEEDKIPVYNERGDDENNEKENDDDESMDIDQNIQVFDELTDNQEIQIFDRMPIFDSGPSGDTSRRTTGETATTNASDTYPPLIPQKKRHFLTAQDINDMGKNAE